MHVERALPVPAALRPWISGIVVGSVVGPGRTVPETPDHATTLTLRTLPGVGSDLVVMGPRTAALYNRAVPGPSCMTLRIRPGRASSVLGRPIGGLADRAVRLTELPGRLTDELAELAADPTGISRGALLARLAATLPGRSTPDGLVGAAAELLVAGQEGVRAVAHRLHISERHLRTLFAEEVGVSPKRFARIDRIRAVLTHSGDRPWRRLAAEAGFYDQSHMTAEFRRFMGVTPTAWADDHLPVPVPGGCPNSDTAG